jgi:hypothetical protein
MTYALSYIISQNRDMTNIFDVPRPDPCGHHTIHIQLPLIKDMLSSKIKQLQPRDRPKFIEKFVEYDSEVGKACSIIKNTLTKMVVKQYELADTFAKMIDDVLRAESGDPDNAAEAPQTAKPPDISHHLSSCDLPSLYFFSFYVFYLTISQLFLFNYYNLFLLEARIHSGTQNTPDLTMLASQPTTELTGTQFEEIYEKQQQMRRAFEGCPDDLDVTAPMETNTHSNAEKQVLYTISSWLHYMLISNLHPNIRQNHNNVNRITNLISNNMPRDINIPHQHIPDCNIMSSYPSSHLPMFDATPQKHVYVSSLFCPL